MSGGELRLVLLAVVLVALAALLAAAEASVSRMSRLRAAELAGEGRRGSAALLTVVGDAAPYLSVSTFVRVTCESFAAVLVTITCVRLVDRDWVALLLAAGVMAVLSFVVVGVSPRTLGRQHSEVLAQLLAPVLVWLTRVLGPVARLLVGIGNMVTPGKGFRDGPFASEAELRDLVDQAGEEALIEASEREMIHSVFELGDTIVREVMVPRTDMVTIERGKTLRQAMSLFLRSGFSRVPVVGDGGPDDVVGIVYLKDVVRRVHADAGAERAVPVDHLMRPAAYVPESKPVDDLLREMQRDQSHVAVVVDEYGGTAGLVTIEDVLEEIVGEITDEYDREAPAIEHLPDGLTRVRASLPLDELGDAFGREIDDDDVDTVGGLLAKALGRVPIPGAVAVVEGLELTAEQTVGRRHRLASVLVREVARVESGATAGNGGPGRGVDPAGVPGDADGRSGAGDHATSA